MRRVLMDGPVPTHVRGGGVGFGEQKAAVGASIRRTGYTLPVNANMTVGRGRAQPEK
jgi:hypothetical protein